MYEEFEVADMGDSGVETMQVAPGGTYFDTVYGVGWAPGFVI